MHNLTCMEMDQNVQNWMKISVSEEPDPGAGAPATVSPEGKEEERQTGREGGEDKTRSELARARPGYQEENKAADCYQRGEISHIGKENDVKQSMFILGRGGPHTATKIN